MKTILAALAAISAVALCCPALCGMARADDGDRVDTAKVVTAIDADEIVQLLRSQGVPVAYAKLAGLDVIEARAPGGESFFVGVRGCEDPDEFLKCELVEAFVVLSSDVSLRGINAFVLSETRSTHVTRLSGTEVYLFNKVWLTGGVTKKHLLHQVGFLLKDVELFLELSRQQVLVRYVPGAGDTPRAQAMAGNPMATALGAQPQAARGVAIPVKGAARPFSDIPMVRALEATALEMEGH